MEEISTCNKDTRKCPKYIEFLKPFYVCVYIHYFSCGCLVVPVLFVLFEKIVIVPLLLCQRSVVCFWALYSFDLSILSPVPHCFDSCSFVVSLEVRYCQPSNFVLQYYFGYSGFCPSTNLEINLLTSTKLLTGSLMGLSWIYGTNWEN